MILDSLSGQFKFQPIDCYIAAWFKAIMWLSYMFTGSISSRENNLFSKGNIIIITFAVRFLTRLREEEVKALTATLDMSYVAKGYYLYFRIEREETHRLSLYIYIYFKIYFAKLVHMFR